MYDTGRSPRADDTRSPACDRIDVWAHCILLCGVVLAIPSCGGGVCGEGTVRHKDTCLPSDPFDRTAPIVTVDPPVRTRNVGNIRLISDEPAEIYVTLDDTPVTTDSLHEPDQLVIPNNSDDLVLRYFAIDLAGNQSLEQTVVWKIDQQGPAPPGRFKLARTNDKRDLSWLPPQNEPRLGGVLVARVEGRMTVQPTSGVAYAVGDEIEPGVTVVEVDGPEPEPATFTETLPAKPGLVRYAAWAFDDLLNYGAPAGDFSLVPLGAQTGMVVIDALTGGVTPGNTAGLILSGTATPAVGGTITAKLTIRNETSRVLFAPKMLVKNGVTFNSDGVFATFPYKAYGAAINPGATANATWTFTGVSGNSLLLQLDVRDNPVVMASMTSRGFGGSVDDLATGFEVKQLAPGPGDARGGFGMLGGGFTPDGQVVFGSRSSATISRWDIQSGNRLQTTELRTQDSHIPQLVLDRSGSIGYALVSESHLRKLRGSGGVDTELVRFDVATLTDQGRVSIGNSRSRDMRITSDGRFLIIATGTASRGVLVVDTETFSVVQTLITGSRVDTAVLSPDERQIAAVGTDIQIFSLADGTKVDTIPLPATGGRVFRATYHGQNELWIGRQSELQKIDLTEIVPPEVFSGRERAIEVFDGKIYGARGERDIDGNITTNFNFQSQRGHWLGKSPF